MNNKRIIAILIIVVGVILVGLIIYFTFFYNFGAKQANKTAPENATSTPTEVLPPSKLNTNVKTGSNDDNRNNQTSTIAVSQPAANAEVVARNFVERFGSWSNQSDEDYLSGLKLISTKSMQEELETKATEIEKNRGDYSKYTGITAQAVASKVVFIDEKNGKSTVDIEVKETTENSSGKESVVNKKIRIDLVKSGKSWKVNSYNWQ